MNLMIKKTGEVLEDVKFIDTSLEPITIEYLDNGVLRETRIKSLSGIKEVKDFKEQEEYWYIDDLGRIQFSSDLLDDIDGRPNNWMIRKHLGNYFGSLEEVKKAVEKLKAWARLKNKGFRFDNWDLDADDEDVNVLLRSDKYKGNQVYALEEELDLLFGGENE